MVGCNDTQAKKCFFFLMQDSGLKTDILPTVLYGMDRYGNDLPGMPMRLDYGADAEDCALLCSRRSDCKAWAFSLCIENGVYCWLKNGVPVITPAACRVNTS